MKVALLGASGFIGSRIVEVFHLEGWCEIKAIVRQFSSLARLARFDLEWQLADATNQEQLAAAFEGCEAVVHAIGGDARVILETIAPVYRAAAAKVRRIVYLSSASVHGQAPAPGTTEETPLSDHQLLPYNNAKIHAERLWVRCQTQAAPGAVEVVRLRPGIVFGPRSRWTGGLARDLLAGRASLIAGGRGICNSIYVDNLIEAIRLALTKPGIGGQAFLLGDAEEITWADFYAPLAAGLGISAGSIPAAAVPSFRRGLTDRLQAIRSSALTQALLPFVPAKLKRGLKGFLREYSQPDQESEWFWPGTPQTEATIELVLLQQCQYKLPFEKARRMLGYEPPISFQEGCRRSLGWLGFAGFPVR